MTWISRLTPLALPLGLVLVICVILYPLSSYGATGPVLLKMTAVPPPPTPLTWKVVRPAGVKLELDGGNTVFKVITSSGGTIWPDVLAQPPNGSVAVLDDGTIMSWQGDVVGHLYYAGYITGVPVSGVSLKWADDNQHVCAILNSNAEPLGTQVGSPPPRPLPPNFDQSKDPSNYAYLWVMAANQPAAMVAQVRGPGEFRVPTVSSCNWLTQTVVIGKSSLGGGFIQGCEPDLVMTVDVRNRQVTATSQGCSGGGGYSRTLVGGP